MLSIIATPIGTIEDISLRAISTLFSVDILLCEDTRRTGNLLHEIAKRYPTFCPSTHKPILMSYYDEVEEKRIPEVLVELTQGKHVGLVSDNGTPLISDPGFRLLREAIKRNIPITHIPGPNAFITAIVLSGMPTHHFTFLGFLPEKTHAQLVLLEKTKASREILPATFGIYVAPHKLEVTLKNIETVYGNCEVVLARELTKIHEDVFRGPLQVLLSQHPAIKGECVLLF